MQVAYGEGAELAFTRFMQAIMHGVDPSTSSFNWAGSPRSSSDAIPTSPASYVGYPPCYRPYPSARLVMTLTSWGLRVPLLVLPLKPVEASANASGTIRLHCPCLPQTSHIRLQSVVTPQTTPTKSRALVFPETVRQQLEVDKSPSTKYALGIFTFYHPRQGTFDPGLPNMSAAYLSQRNGLSGGDVPNPIIGQHEITWEMKIGDGETVYLWSSMESRPRAPRIYTSHCAMFGDLRVEPRPLMNLKPDVAKGFRGLWGAVHGGLHALGGCKGSQAFTITSSTSDSETNNYMGWVDVPASSMGDDTISHAENPRRVLLSSIDIRMPARPRFKSTRHILWTCESAKPSLLLLNLPIKLIDYARPTISRDVLLVPPTCIQSVDLRKVGERRNGTFMLHAQIGTTRLVLDQKHTLEEGPCIMNLTVLKT
ncbi:hypothetical protein DEU56DRAFT_761246 [Suillus clintonianus]|uniref:uncharacterized protein n=1 Tax=Suillus clintonianus TaxID=1904413 RepID=UPI001B87ED6D|nr:uncharacterized protein DEU56DRAFT_761246 [Suillus clintonianus]KAG2118363.1 hypothetical protein DEU56DRAFT_761246 [Suillus clintonianus]